MENCQTFYNEERERAVHLKRHNLSRNKIKLRWWQFYTILTGKSFKVWQYQALAKMWNMLPSSGGSVSWYKFGKYFGIIM